MAIDRVRKAFTSSGGGRRTSRVAPGRRVLAVLLFALVIDLVIAPVPRVPAAEPDDSSSSLPVRGARPGPAIWTGDMEEGSLADWEGEDGYGGEFNSGIADAAASDEVARTGEWSARLSITAPPESGTRLFRWGEPRSYRDLYYEAWFYLPQNYQVTGDPAVGRYWNLVQFKSTSEDGSLNDPFWMLNVNVGDDGQLTPELVWWHKVLEGPREGESGYQTFSNREEAIPVGRWFRIRARLQQSKDFDGIVQFWVDDRKVFDLRDVRTGYPNCEHNAWCVDQAWSVNLYSDGLAPTPSVIYVDDARIMRPRRCSKPPAAEPEAS